MSRRYQLNDSCGDGTLWTLVDTMPLRVIRDYQASEKEQGEAACKRLNEAYESLSLDEIIDIVIGLVKEESE